MHGFFAERLGDLINLSATELKALDRLEERDRAVKRGTALLRENDPATELFILKQGMMMSFVILDDGSRQILRILFPGDLLAVSSLVWRGSTESVVAVTDSVVAPFDRAAMAALIEQHPRLAAVIMVLNQLERVALTDRLAALGRSSAKARVAALLLELRNRMRITKKDMNGGFQLGLTQEEIGDATGLTAVHVNRMLRQLEDDGQIARETGRVWISNEPALLRTANYIDRFAGVDLSWLPKAR